MVKVTKAMMNRAENAHFRKEDSKSLTKSHATNYVYYKQQGKLKIARGYLTGADVKKEAKKIEMRKPATKRRVNRNPFDFNFKI